MQFSEDEIGRILSAAERVPLGEWDYVVRGRGDGAEDVRFEFHLSDDVTLQISYFRRPPRTDEYGHPISAYEIVGLSASAQEVLTFNTKRKQQDTFSPRLASLASHLVSIYRGYVIQLVRQWQVEAETAEAEKKRKLLDTI